MALPKNCDHHVVQRKASRTLWQLGLSLFKPIGSTLIAPYVDYPASAHRLDVFAPLYWVRIQSKHVLIPFLLPILLTSFKAISYIRSAYRAYLKWSRSPEMVGSFFWGGRHAFPKPT